MNLPSTSISGVLALLLAVGACELINGSHGQTASVSGIDLENRTEDDLYVLVLTQEALSRVRIAPELGVESDEPGRIVSGGTLNLPLEVVSADIQMKDTLVFILYNPDDTGAGGAGGAGSADGAGGVGTADGAGGVGVAGGAGAADRFQLARMLTLDLQELAKLSYRFVVTPADLRSEHLFGDPYAIMSGDDEAMDEMYPPRLEGGELRLWVGFGGCRTGSFTLSHQVSGRGMLLTLIHDYPDTELDCRRYNYRELAIPVPDDVTAAERVLLLNPKSGADPYRDAFVVGPAD